jgi:hypothetical protein
MKGSIFTERGDFAGGCLAGTSWPAGTRDAELGQAARPGRAGISSLSAAARRRPSARRMRRYTFAVDQLMRWAIALTSRPSHSHLFLAPSGDRVSHCREDGVPDGLGRVGEAGEIPTAYGGDRDSGERAKHRVQSLLVQRVQRGETSAIDDGGDAARERAHSKVHRTPRAPRKAISQCVEWFAPCLGDDHP